MGKGSGRRQNRDDKAYADNWDRIFGKSRNVEDILFPANSKPIKSIEGVCQIFTRGKLA
jgi:hypothetical protein